MFHYFKTPYIICTFFAKSIHNKCIRPYFLLRVVLVIYASDLPKAIYIYQPHHPNHGDHYA